MIDCFNDGRVIAVDAVGADPGDPAIQGPVEHAVLELIAG